MQAHRQRLIGQVELRRIQRYAQRHHFVRNRIPPLRTRIKPLNCAGIRVDYVLTRVANFGKGARVIRAAAVDLSFRQPTETDHARVLAVLDSWWGGFKGEDGTLERALLVPRLYFQHFTTTSCLVEYSDGTLAAFLVGFLSHSDPTIAYIHFVGVDPALHGQGVGRSLYGWFFDRARALGAQQVKCITSPGNSGSQAFHACLGYATSPCCPTMTARGWIGSRSPATSPTMRTDCRSNPEWPA